MQQITRLMREAFQESKPFKKDNTEVRVTDFGTYIYLFKNRIAHKDNYGNIYITTSGWPTRTTKDRLNALPGVSINQHKGYWYLNGNKWDGSTTMVEGVVC